MPTNPPLQRYREVPSRSVSTWITTFGSETICGLICGPALRWTQAGMLDLAALLLSLVLVVVVYSRAPSAAFRLVFESCAMRVPTHLPDA